MPDYNEPRAPLDQQLARRLDAIRIEETPERLLTLARRLQDLLRAEPPKDDR